MAQPRGALALAAAAVLLLLTTATADEPASPLDVALSAEGQTSEPVSPAKLEASGESDLTTSAQRLGQGLTADSFEGTGGAQAAVVALGSDSSSSSLDALNSGSFSTDALAGEARGAPVADLPAQSNESEEGMDRDLDSEEALASQGV
ncbi:uncharacterized protein V3H86_000618 [Mergus octosetaceus]